MLGNLRNLLDELTQQRNNSKDFVADSRSLTVANCRGQLRLQGLQEHGEASQFLSPAGMPISDHSLGQIAGYQKPAIPIKYARELAAQKPELAAYLLGKNVEENPRKHLVRLLNGRVRAVLSDRYRVLDNYDLAFTALEAAEQVEAYPLRCKLTENRMELQLTTRSIWETIDVDQRDTRNRGAHWSYGGDSAIGYRQALELDPSSHEANPNPETVNPLVTISNSETGAGGFKVAIGILRAACINGSIIDQAVTQVHLGGRLEEGLYRSETMEQDARAIMMKATDAIRAAFHPASFAKIVNRAQAAEDTAIEAPVEAVGHVVKSFDLSEDRRDALLERFLKDYQPTAYGLSQAVSRVAQDITDADEQTRFEEIAGDIIKEPALAIA